MATDDVEQIDSIMAKFEQVNKGLDEILAAKDALVKRCTDAVEIAVKYGGIDGDHHKAWVIDQMVRKLLGEKDYAKLVAECAEQDFAWDEGITP